MRRECRERFPRHPIYCDPDMHHGTCVTHVPWCMPGSLTSGFLWSRWWGKRSRQSRRMHNPQFYVSGERPIMIIWTRFRQCPEAFSWEKIHKKFMLINFIHNTFNFTTTSLRPMRWSNTQRKPRYITSYTRWLIIHLNWLSVYFALFVVVILTDWGWDKIAAISWMRMYEFCLRFHWSFSK